MKLSLSWLRTHLRGDYSAKDVEASLVSLGLEVEEVIDEGKRLDGVIVAHIDSAEKHPDADRLQVCKVNTGKEILNIVCGGKNARPGITVALAKIGTVIPSTGQALKLGKVRGIESQGMLCSSEELLLDIPCDGILEWETKASLGTPLSEAFGMEDVIFDISITPNRADCFSVYGLARDLYAYFAYLGKAVELLPYPFCTVNEGQQGRGGDVSKIMAPKIINLAPMECPEFHLFSLPNIQNEGSPLWLKKRLQSMGLRPHSFLVDVTNYMCFDVGRPLHVFDAKKVVGDITLRLSHDGEVLEALDEKTYTLKEGMLVICDEGGIISLAGIMGGKRTAVSEETTHALLESAYFNPVNIALTGQALGIISDARMRFERGVDPTIVQRGGEHACALILAEGEEETARHDKKNENDEEMQSPVGTSHPKNQSKHITLSLHKLHALTGESIPLSECERILTLLGFSILEKDSAHLKVQSPPWRVDMLFEEDLVEEIVRLRGVDHIQSLPLPLCPMPQKTHNPKHIATKVLASLGFHEMVTFSFVDEKAATLFQGKSALIHLENPISVELSIMRPSILPTLLMTAKRNLDLGQGGACVFEVGPIFDGHIQGEDKGKQRGVIAALMAGTITDPSWSCKEEKADVFAIKNALFQTLAPLGVDEKNIHITRETPSHYHPGQSGVVKQGNRILAYFGMIHPSVLKDMDVDAPASGFEIFTDTLPLKIKRPLVKDLPPFQPVTKDFAFLFESNFEAGRLLSVLWQKLSRQEGFPKTAVLEDVTLFDVFENFKEEALCGKKSLAFTISLQPQTHTLSEDDLNNFLQSVITLVEKETGGKLRS